MPVSAVFTLDRPLASFGVSLNMRLNGPSNVRAIVEASDGRLYMTSTLVKTSGLGACAAPPVTNPAEALATLGNMELQGHRTIAADTTIKPKAMEGQVRIDLRHPQHSGMQMDQISLLYIPARYLKTLEVWGGSEKFFTMEGSISLSENPSIVFDLPDGDKGALKVRATDTENAIFERVFPLGGA
jgi:sulfur-oxidizing protein SoxY